MGVYITQLNEQKLTRNELQERETHSQSFEAGFALTQISAKMYKKGNYEYDVLCMCAQSCPTHCSLTDSPPGFSVRGIFQARILERVAISYSRGSSLPLSPTSPALAGGANELPLSHLGSPFSCVALGKLFNLPEC